MEIPLTMSIKIEKFDGDPPRFRRGQHIPLLTRIVAFFTGEVLVKDPVEVIERTYSLTEEMKNGTT